jgi:hypothetical protein
MDFIGACDFEHKLEIFLKEFSQEKEYVLWAVGAGFNDLLSATAKNLRIKYCVDSDPRLHGSKIRGLDVLPPEQLFEEDKQNTKVIITPAGYTQIQIADQLKSLGYNENSYCYAYDLGMVWNLAMYNKAVLPECSIAITAVCTLKCKNCTEYLPMFSNDKLKHSPFEDVKQNIDLLFSTADRVINLLLGTGEALLHPKIVNILQYIAHNYNKRYGDLIIFTNGTYVPKVEVIDALKETNSIIRVSNYQPIIGNRSKIISVVESFTKAGIPHIIVNQFGSQKDASSLWSDLGSPHESHGKNPHEKSELFKKCGFYCRFLWDGKIYHCPPIAGTVMGALYSAYPGDYFDLSGPVNKYNLIKFYLKHNKNGYISFCDRCDGFGIVTNPKTTLAGVQLR